MHLEVGGVAANGVIHNDVLWRLQDVPDLGYLSSDTPYARGELLVKTDIMIDVPLFT
jgi:fatty acid CoA ligase FadD9